MRYIIYPAFNEAAVIGSVLRDLDEEIVNTGLDATAIVVDDGSTDATVAVAEEAAAATGGRLRLVVLRHEVNAGLGAGLRTGIYWVLDHSAAGDVVVTLDADGTHPARMIPDMTARVDAGYDVVIASRYREGSAVIGVPFYRRVLSDAGRLVYAVAFPMDGVRDYTCGFRAYGIACLQRARRVYGSELAEARGFEATVDLLLRLRSVDIRATEVPFELDYRVRAGQSKMKVFKTIRASLRIVGRRLRDRFGRYSPGRVASILSVEAPPSH